MKLVGANPEAPVTGLKELPGKVNYFLGNDPEKWRANMTVNIGICRRLSAASNSLKFFARIMSSISYQEAHHLTEFRNSQA